MSRLIDSLLWRLARNTTFGRLVRETYNRHPLIYGGPRERLEIDPTAEVVDATLNLSSGRISIGPHVFFGHHVSVLTGTHDIHQFGEARAKSVADSGRNITIDEGVWVATNATILGPCRIGAHSVVAAGAVVTGDVEAFSIVGGVPAKVIGRVTRPGLHRPTMAHL
ncbi:MAG: hypothetical protein QOK49_4545 [Baekduia sp.]|jgi:carbonic anhydrase/acetyltransferase-like protein (isoleucine patch superfamily)|nr:hypothetical protein [Baekduia sp.]